MHFALNVFLATDILLSFKCQDHFHNLFLSEIVKRKRSMPWVMVPTNTSMLFRNMIALYSIQIDFILTAAILHTSMKIIYDTKNSLKFANSKQVWFRNYTSIVVNKEKFDIDDFFAFYCLGFGRNWYDNLHRSSRKNCIKKYK